MKHITQKIAKKASLVLLILSLIISINTNAEKNYHNRSSLKLLLPQTGIFTVVFDHTKFYEIENCFKMNNIHQGNHRIKIIELIIRRGRVVDRQVIYNGVITIPKNAKVWAKLNHRGYLRIDRVIHLDYRGKGRGKYNNHYYEKNNDLDDEYNDESHNSSKFKDYYDEEWFSFENKNNNEYDDDSKYENSGNNNKENSYNIALTSIKNQSFDSERLKIAKNTAKQLNLNSAEVLEITKLFSFESSRLDFAKYAYDYTSDKANYNIVLSAFQFSSSTSELQEYIASRN